MIVIQTKNGSPALCQMQQVGCSLASQLFYNFDELARTSNDFPAHLMGDVIVGIPSFGDDNLCIANLPAVILVSYKHSLTTGNLNLYQLEQMEKYHPIIGLWGDTMQYQFSSRFGMSALIMRANDILDNCSFNLCTSGAISAVQLQKDNNNDKPFIQGIRHCLEMLKKHII
eukprot:12726295-Ditylum_brightwellii.AAC.1